MLITTQVMAAAFEKAASKHKMERNRLKMPRAAIPVDVKIQGKLFECSSPFAPQKIFVSLSCHRASHIGIDAAAKQVDTT